MHDLGLGAHGITEHECAKVARRASTKGRHEQAFVLLRPGHEILHIARLDLVRIDQQHKVRADHLTHWYKVFLRIVGQLAIGAGRNAELPSLGQHDGVTVSWSPRSLTCRYQTSSTRFVVNDHTQIAPTLREFLRQQPGHHIGAGARRKANDHAHRFVWVVAGLLGQRRAGAQHGGDRHACAGQHGAAGDDWMECLVHDAFAHDLSPCFFV